MVVGNVDEGLGGNSLLALDACLIGISGPVCYCGYTYATDKLFHENMDEKYVYQWPWLYKRLNKWFPIEIDSPFGLRV